MVTIKEVAKESGVSVSTASIVLRGEAKIRKVSPITEDAVIETARKLGYKVNVSARKLRGSNESIPVIGVMWSSDLKSAMTLFLEGIDREIRQKKINVEVIIRQYEPNKIDEALKFTQNCNAVIVCNLKPRDIEILQNYKSSVPIIIYERLVEGFTCVYHDSEKMGEIVASEFLKQKRRKAVIICQTQSKSYYSIDKCIEAFSKNALKGGMEVSLMQIEMSMANGYSSMKTLLESENRPDCVYSLTSIYAFGASRAILESGISVPDDFGYISNSGHNYELEENAAIPFSVVTADIENIAAECLNQALLATKSPFNSPKMIEMPIRYIKRKT